MSKPDTNQASEDEIRETLLDKLAIIKYGEAYKWLFDVDKSNVDLWTKDLLALIRTEKLKLLAAVRERVVGGDEPGITNVMIAAEHAKQTDVLTQLEAEL